MAQPNSIDESQYKVDFDIAKGYIDFSSELLRLSLLAISGFGVLAILKIKEEDKANALQHPGMFLASTVLFALCAGSTLFHRYFAADCMSWYIAFLRASASGNAEKAERERRGFHNLLKASKWSLICSEFFFGGAVLLFIVAIFKLYY